MKKSIVSLFAFAVLATSVFAGSLTEKAGPMSAGQVVPETKKVSQKTYRKGRFVTKTTYYHGRKTTKKVWVKGNEIGHKTVKKTKEVVMGPKKRTP